MSGSVNVRRRVRAEMQQRDVGRSTIGNRRPLFDLNSRIARIGWRRRRNGDADVIDSHGKMVNGKW